MTFADIIIAALIIATSAALAVQQWHFIIGGSDADNWED